MVKSAIMNDGDSLLQGGDHDHKASYGKSRNKRDISDAISTEQSRANQYSEPFLISSRDNNFYTARSKAAGSTQKELSQTHDTKDFLTFQDQQQALTSSKSP